MGSLAKGCASFRWRKKLRKPEELTARQAFHLFNSLAKERLCFANVGCDRTDLFKANDTIAID